MVSGEGRAGLVDSELWRSFGEDPPSIARLLVLPSTRSTRDVARSFERTLATAYPARTADVLASLIETPWSGDGIVWAAVDGRTSAAGTSVRLGR
jgi:hypothetical protein